MTLPMESLKKEIHSLISRLESRPADVAAIEHQVLDYLRRLSADAESAAGPERLAGRFAELTRFWSEAIPWCSQLSRDIERLIIIHGDMVERNGD